MTADPIRDALERVVSAFDAENLPYDPDYEPDGSKSLDAAIEIARAVLAAPPESEVAFPEGSYAIPLAQRVAAACEDGASIPRLGIIGTDKHSIPLTTAEARQIRDALAAPETAEPVGTGERRFPIQGDSWRSVEVDGGAMTQVPRSSVPWSVAEVAYKVYAALFGTEQSLERLAERGGFGRGELLWLLDGGRNDRLLLKPSPLAATPAPLRRTGVL